MKPGIPWSVKGIEPEVREAAKHAARRAGMTLGEWLNSVILDQNEPLEGLEKGIEDAQREEYFDREPEPAPPPRRTEPQPRQPEAAIRLEDIAHQLSQLAQRERESATIMPYEAPRYRSEDRETLNRIFSRIDNNERQAVEAFTAVNERLSVLGRQIAMATRPQTIEKPEDVPGYSALETAIRNVVEHIEVSEKRTRDSLKSMQDRLGDMAERATQPNSPDELVRAAPAFSSLEARIAELSGRLQRSENMLHSGLPDVVRKEISQLADRIEDVRSSSEMLASQAQASAAGVARNELRDIESRILGVLKEAQSTIGSQQSTIVDLQRLRGEVGSLNKRIDDVKQATASERDVHALRVAVEQLSTRVAQGPDMRPIADMDRRLGELTQKLDQNSAATRNLPQFGELERRIAELDHKLGEAMRLQGDQQSVKALEQHIAAVNDRVSRTENQLGHLETMERAIHQLYDSLEQSRSHVSQTAEDAANRAVERVLAAQAQSGPSPELRAMEEGLRAVRESAASAEQRNQETLEAVHETLEQIVNKLAELETASAGHQLAVNMAQQAAQQTPPEQAPAPSYRPAAPPQFYDPSGTFDPHIFTSPAEPAPQDAAGETEATEPHAAPDPVSVEPELQVSVQTAVPSPAADFSPGADVGGDDFIAAARRAAQAAASRPAVAPADVRHPVIADAPKSSRFSLFKRNRQPEPVTYVNGQPVVEKPAAAANENKRKKLVLAGIVLLAAVSAFAFNILAKPKPVKQTSSIETPAEVMPLAPTATQTPAPGKLSGDLAGLLARATGQQISSAPAPQNDLLITGSLPAKKTDATLASIVAQPGESRAEMPPADVGTEALRAAAARGDAKAQFIIASRYLDGQGVAQDLPKAAYWYQVAAERGLAPAQYRLATLFERGKGVPQDAATALLWYERAAEGGNIKSMHNAAVIAAGNQAGTPNYDKAFRWFKSAAERGLHDSQFNLAVLYERGLGTRVDAKEAYFWYMLAAKQGDADAGKRADKLVATLATADANAVNGRIANWSPVPGTDEANVVALSDPAWGEQTAATPVDAALAGSDAAMPMLADNADSASADPVAEAQQLLMKLGYNVGTPDGKLGSRTANAIRLFQLQVGMRVTGNVSPDLLEAMRTKAGA